MPVSLVECLHPMLILEGFGKRRSSSKSAREPPLNTNPTSDHEA